MPPIHDVLYELLTTPGPSGYERSVAKVLSARAAQRLRMVDGARLDPSGNLHINSACFTPSRDMGRVVMLTAHMDEIGLIVQEVASNGMLHVGPIGGWDPRVVLGQRVAIQPRDAGATAVLGVVGVKATHLMDNEEQKAAQTLFDENVWVDIGARSDEEVYTMGVDVGDWMVLDSTPILLGQDHDVIASRALDNRVGCYIVFRVLETLAERGSAPAVGVFTTREEIGGFGIRSAYDVISQVAAFGPRPEYCVAVDGTFATDDDSCEEDDKTRRQYGYTSLGLGPVLHRAPILSRDVEDRLYHVAQSNDIPTQTQVIRETSGTDIDMIVDRRAQCGLVSIAMRNIHSPVEMASLRDIDAAIDLLVGFCESIYTDGI